MTISILIATDNSEQAQLIVAQLAKDYSDIVISIKSQSLINDFDKHQPDVLILAFANLAKAQEYYEALYESSNHITNCTHRTVLLCHEDEIEQAHELFRQEVYDEYIPFMPTPYDSHQLPRAIHRASLSLKAGAINDTNSELIKRVRRLSNLEAKFESALKLAHQQLDIVNQASDQIKIDQLNVLTNFLQSLNELTNNSSEQSLQPLIDELEESLINQKLNTLTLPLLKIKNWFNDLRPLINILVNEVTLLKVVAQKTPPTVLIVDDDKFAQMMLNDIVATENYSVLFADSGIDALKLLRKHKPDIILMDMNMPALGGIETISRIKDSPRFSSIPIIMITGSNAKKDVIESLKAGAADFIVKPVSHGILLDKIELLLH
ncbi:MAG: response regulator [Methylococcales bacterium]|nr:MAG: response regulator [Methylococcales bacterium]